MTTLLKEAISQVRALPKAEQDKAAEVLLAFTRPRRAYTFTPAQIKGIRHAIKQADAGKFASDREVAAMWKRFGL